MRRKRWFGLWSGLLVLSLLTAPRVGAQPAPVQIGPHSMQGENPLDMRAGVRARLGPDSLGGERLLLSGRAEGGQCLRL